MMIGTRRTGRWVSFLILGLTLLALGGAPVPAQEAPGPPPSPETPGPAAAGEAAVETDVQERGLPLPGAPRVLTPLAPAAPSPPPAAPGPVSPPGDIRFLQWTWTATGSLRTGRYDYAAALLPSGKVLITGGVRVPHTGVILPSPTAELYDPVAGTFTYTGVMGGARHLHSATVLPTGKVLIAGGHSGAGGDTLCTAELYDPAKGSFHPTGSMLRCRYDHRAILLPTGKVLLAGGAYRKLGSDITFTGSLDSADLYDPVTGTFTFLGAMGTSRTGHTTTLLPTGKVLLAGGSGLARATAELYDPITGTFSPTGAMGTHRYYSTATLLPTGKVLIAGGETHGTLDAPSAATAELYDPVTGTFSATGTMGIARKDHTATLLPNGKVLVAGGSSSATAELYDPVTGAFSNAGNMAAARWKFTASRLLNGNILIAGGGGPPSSIHPTAELYTRLSAAPPRPDLVATAVLDLPASLEVDTKFPIRDLVLNQGTWVSGVSTTRYYLSTDRSKTADDVLVGSRPVPSLVPGELSMGTAAIRIPSTSPVGTYYLLSCADDLNVLAELNETNNCLASPTPVQVKTPMFPR